MKRLLTTAAATAALLAVGDEAQAQARATLFDFDLYAGGAWTSAWLDMPGDEENIVPGPSGAFGAALNFWFTPRVGVRLHGAFLPQRLEHDDFGAAEYDLNTYIYDVNLAFRPWVGNADAGWRGGVYFFLGGGGLTADVAGFRGDGCLEPQNIRDKHGACLPLDWQAATVGQGSVGTGMTLLPLTGNIGLFGELAAHVYSSPFHTGPGWAPPAGANQAQSRVAVTPRLVAGLRIGLGDLLPPPPPPSPPPPPPPPPPAAPTQPERQIQVCVVTPEGQMQTVAATFRPATNDTVVGGRQFREVHSPQAGQYAAGQGWFVQDAAIRVMNREYVKFGVTRLVEAGQLTRAATYQGVPVFTESGAGTPPQVIFVPVRPGCEVQPYQLRTAIRPRG